MNVVFLDYDGVINTVYWEQEESIWRASIKHPNDNRVNNIQAVQWVSEFCKKYDYKIVVSSTWRSYDNWKECLQNAQLCPDIEILGCTEKLVNHSNSFTKRKSEEIADYLLRHPEIDRYLIFDDENLTTTTIGERVFNLQKHLVLCNCHNGFLYAEYIRACYIHEHYNTIVP